MQERDVQAALGCLIYVKYVVNSTQGHYYIFMEVIDQEKADNWAREIARQNGCDVVRWYLYNAAQEMQHIKDVFNTEVGGWVLGNLIVNATFTSFDGCRAALIGEIGSMGQ